MAERLFLLPPPGTGATVAGGTAGTAGTAAGTGSSTTGTTSSNTQELVGNFKIAIRGLQLLKLANLL